MNRIVELSIWIGAIGIATVTILGQLTNSDNYGQIEAAVFPDQIIGQDLDDEVLAAIQSLNSTTRENSSSITDIASIFHLPLPAVPTREEKIGDVTDGAEGAAVESDEEEPPESTDTDTDRVETEVDLPIDDGPAPVEEIETPKVSYNEATWLEYVGRMTRDGIEVYYIKNTRSGLIFQVTEGVQTGYAILKGVENDMLHMTIADENLSVRLIKR